MSMYHPMEDANHCFFRMLMLASRSPYGIAVEAFRIMDFYCLFPSALSEIQLPQQFSKYKKKFRLIPKQFELMPNRAALYDELRHVQNNALGCLISLGFLDREAFLANTITWTKRDIPTNISQRMDECPILVEDWFDFLTQHFPTFPVDGPKGWKDRTHLSEYRYDSI